jgi:hypothetical protein
LARDESVFVALAICSEGTVCQMNQPCAEIWDDPERMRVKGGVLILIRGMTSGFPPGSFWLGPESEAELGTTGDVLGFL